MLPLPTAVPHRRRWRYSGQNRTVDTAERPGYRIAVPCTAVSNRRHPPHAILQSGALPAPRTRGPPPGTPWTPPPPGTPWTPPPGLSSLPDCYVLCSDPDLSGVVPVPVAVLRARETGRGVDPGVPGEHTSLPNTVSL